MVQAGRTLKDKTIVLTRPCSQADEEVEIIKKFGGNPYLLPTIEIKPSTNLPPIKKFIVRLNKGEVNFVIFMSINGVKHLFNAAEALRLTNKLIDGLKITGIVAVGPKTAEELKNRSVHVILVPKEYTSEGIAESMRAFDVGNKTVVIPRTSAANPILKEKLTEMGALVEEVYVYESGLPANSELNEEFLQDLNLNKIHALIFGSGLCAKNLFAMLNDMISSANLSSLLNSKVKVVAIGPLTAKTLADIGVRVDVMPEKHTFEDALAALALSWEETPNAH